MDFNENQKLTLGKGSYHISINEKSNTVFVSCKSDNSIHIINGDTLELIEKIIITQPKSHIVNHHTNKLYAINNMDNRWREKDEGEVITIIDLNTNKSVGTVYKNGGFGVLCADPKSNMIYCFSKKPKEQVCFIDGNSGKITRIIDLNSRLYGGSGSIMINSEKGTILCPTQQGSVPDEIPIINKIETDTGKINQLIPNTETRQCDYLEWLDVMPETGDIFFTGGANLDHFDGRYFSGDWVPMKHLYRINKDDNFHFIDRVFGQIESLCINKNTNKLYLFQTNSDKIIVFDNEINEIENHKLYPLKKQKSMWRDPAEVRMACNSRSNTVFFTSQNTENRKEYCLYKFSD